MKKMPIEEAIIWLAIGFTGTMIFIVGLVAGMLIF